ncbi:TOBE-like domain-containing protein [Leptolyngbya sp. FACHB-36]|uniref:TOBE-like domain-containing protein n=1 Tax=Leptolyngbya sp. FACHB-36 TaxID=2692808 RepID=UPI00167FE47E|nr:TOBE-like domain-containing protein [Leptolyngbya sp. FACHB-36]
MGISVENVSKEFGSFTALDRVSVEIKTGSLVALLGPSGSGKSTLLRMIAGLDTPSSGQIFLSGQDTTHRSIQERNIGFVFQHYALFKHLTVRQNIAFALEIRKVPAEKVRPRVQELLQLIQLEGLGDRYPSQLSGGQRQRVALARSLATQPSVLLLDEPFGALDAKVRKDLRVWLRRLHHEVQVTTVFVTHDQEEAMEVADEIVVMNQGRIEQVGTPAELYDQPATPFVMSFIGPVNILPPPTARLFPGQNAGASQALFLRPHDVVISPTREDGMAPASVSRVVHMGREVQTELTLSDGASFTAVLPRDRFDQLQLQRNQQVFVKPKQARAFPQQHAAPIEATV